LAAELRLTGSWAAWGVAVALGVLVEVWVAVDPAGPTGPDGAELLHPTIKAAGSNANTMKQPIIIFFTFSSPEKIFGPPKQRMESR
jgi:hypothetical protein